MASALEAAAAVITSELAQATDPTGANRKPPAAASRFSRGGKTSFLRCLYDRLQSAEIAPIIVNLNGDFQLQHDETVLQALARVIGKALCPSLKDEEGPYDLTCDINSLKQFINSRPERVVLLVDELNALGTPLAADASFFFLNKRFWIVSIVIWCSQRMCPFLSKV